MSHLSFRPLLTLVVSLTALGVGCSSDQKTPNTPESMPSAESPADTSTPQPGGDTAPAPNGEPVSTPPASPPPSGLNDTSSSSNSLAMPGSPTTQPATPALSQAQIAMITDLANTSEIEQGKLAQSKAKSPSVKKFAAMMVKHHTDAKAEQSKLYKSLSLTPTQSPPAIELKDSADKSLGALRAADGAAFDKAYIEGQIDAHQKVLDTIDQKLMPAAVDQSLIEELKKTRALVESHLTQAKDVLSELDKNRTR